MATGQKKEETTLFAKSSEESILESLAQYGFTKYDSIESSESGDQDNDNNLEII